MIAASTPAVADELRALLPADVASPMMIGHCRFLALRHLMMTRDWDYAQLVDDTPARLSRPGGDDPVGPWYEAIDDWLALVLDPPPTGELAVLLVFSPGPDAPGAFVLASSSGIGPGPVDNVRPEDLAPTLLDLARQPAPAGMTGRAFDLSSPISEDEELAVIERLRGLGYLS